VLIHGVLSTPVMRRLDEHEGQTQERPSP
jgi:hypothetical protein